MLNDKSSVVSRQSSEAGQSLIELIVVTAVAVIVVGALTFATIASLRNAAFAKNQSQATKLAQDGLERMRSLRDRDSDIQTLNIPDRSGNQWGTDAWFGHFMEGFPGREDHRIHAAQRGQISQRRSPYGKGYSIQL